MPGEEGLPQRAIPAVYMRGGTSRALVFHQADLPPRDDAAWGAIFAASLGSPDPGGRQLDGLGGGVSSLSKVAVVGRSPDAEADVDYTFAQVAIDRPAASFAGNCGNISSAIGPFAYDEGLIARRDDGAAIVRIRNTNTGKIIRADFAVRGGRAAVTGDFRIAGVAQAGSAIRLAFLDPGGAATGRLLPTGQATETLGGSGLALAASLVDAANPTVMVLASDLGLRGDEAPAALAGDPALMRLLETVRVEAALKMGLVRERQVAEEVLTNMPLVAILSSPQDGAAHLRLRMISAGQPHKATPLTGAMAVAIAARLEGTLAHRLTRPPKEDQPILIEHASGVLPVDATVRDGAAVEAVVFRTARRLMAGEVFVPSELWPASPLQ